MTNKEAFKAIAIILPIAKEILKDPELLNIWYRKINLKPGMTEQEIKIAKANYGVDKVTDLIPYIISNHDKNIYKILAVLNDKKPKEIEEQGFMETIAQLTEALNDEALQKLFTL